MASCLLAAIAAQRVHKTDVEAVVAALRSAYEVLPRDEVLAKLDVQMTSAYIAVSDLARKRKLTMGDAALVIAVVGTVVWWLLGLLGISAGGGLLGAIIYLIVAAVILMISDRFVPGMKVKGFTGAIIAAIAIGAADAARFVQREFA